MEIGSHRDEATKMMKLGVLANFVFKGNRNYVQGGDIYSEALNIARELWGCYPDEVIGTFHKLLRNQGIFRIHMGEKESTTENMYARFVFKLDEKKYELVLNDSNQAIEKSRPYDEEDLLRFNEVTEKSIIMKVRNDYHYIEQIIAMTKRLHQVVYFDIHDKWLFTRINIKKLINPDDYLGRSLEIRAERKLQNILSQCSIFLNDSPIGFIFFSAAGDKR